MRALAWTLLFVAAGIGSAGCMKGAPKKEPFAKQAGGDGGGGTVAGAAPAPAGADKREAPAKAAAGTAQGQGGQQHGPRAGQLTAGSFDDNLHLPAFYGFLRKLRQNSGLADLAAQFQGRRVTILVKDTSGRPVDNAHVIVRAAGIEIQLLSRTDGRAIVLTPWDGLPADADWTVTVTPPDGGKAVTRPCGPGVDRLDIVLPDAAALPTSILDLALVVDTTGSMGDELEYLKSEMKWIATAIKARFPQVKQRYALIVYRDEGDDYVTRTYTFTESLEQLLANIQAQRADGGGDYPEAVHKAMEAATQLPWSPGRAARVLIHVADAPPHLEDFQRSLTAVDRLRKTGVAFYPVACSGYDAACELHMRVSALLTGSQFLFLTDDSGIGEAHAEPTVPGYHVERLNKLLVRLIAGEVAGRPIEPQADDILRTVGNPQKAGQQ
jgi:hypothetical protein